MSSFSDFFNYHCLSYPFYAVLLRKLFFSLSAEPSQPSNMEVFAKAVNGIHTLIVLLNVPL